MNKNELIVFIISLVLVILISISFTFLCHQIYKKEDKKIISGQYDNDLINQYNPNKNKRNKIISNVISYSFIFILVGIITFQIIGRLNNPLIPVGQYNYVSISSNSMKEKDENNTYLFENDLNNQFQTFDLIEVKKVKEPKDIKIYDIVGFLDKNKRVIIHRIIDIKDNTYITQGDSNDINDLNVLYDKPLKFNDILGKYTGKKIPFIGILGVFISSPSGIVTITSIIYCLFTLEFYKNRNEIIIRKRLEEINKLGGTN